VTDTFESLSRSLGAAIKAYRKDRDKIQEDVAHDADLSLRHYQQIESGDMNATLRSIHNIAQVLGTDMHTLFARAYRLRSSLRRSRS
jgi:transcriptional regulator with XRE-family HTH domain